jgi:hypothetical protein
MSLVAMVAILIAGFVTTEIIWRCFYFTFRILDNYFNR